MADDQRDGIGRAEQVHDPMSVVQALAAQATLDADGHPRRGGFLPPIPYQRRMFAGARLGVRRRLVIGAPAIREGTIREVLLKSRRGGALAVVTVPYRLLQDGMLCLEEERDIVCREPGPRVSAPAPTVQPDTRLIFRCSALTFNARRIRYDRAFAAEEEGYPGHVVHGPLTAVLFGSAAVVASAEFAPPAAA